MNNNGEPNPSEQPAHPPLPPSPANQPAQPQPAPETPRPQSDPNDDQPSEALTYEEEVAVDKALDRAEEDKLDREAVLEDIIRRIKSGERAMLVFCKDEDVRDFDAFPLMEAEGRLAIGRYEDEVSCED